METTQETTTQAPSVLSTNETQSVELFTALINDLLKFRTKKTASAAARARKKASTLAKLLKVIRKDLQEQKKVNAAEKKAKAVVA